MGHRITQTIFECSICELIPQDGEYLWRMGSEIWCEKCVIIQDKENEETEKT